jgi:hypothetical protein
MGKKIPCPKADNRTNDPALIVLPITVDHAAQKNHPDRRRRRVPPRSSRPRRATSGRYHPRQPPRMRPRHSWSTRSPPEGTPPSMNVDSTTMGQRSQGLSQHQITGLVRQAGYQATIVTAAGRPARRHGALLALTLAVAVHAVWWLCGAPDFRITPRRVRAPD